MAMEITGNFNSYAAQSMAASSAANSTKKKEAEKTAETAGSGKIRDGRVKGTAEYASELAKLVPSMEFKVGNSYSCAKSGKTLTIDPRILEKMQNDPEQEKETKELIKGVETANRLFDGIYKSTGWTVVFRHGYIDENGKYRHIALIRNDFMLNMSDELREERRKNSEKLIEKTKEKATEEREELQEALEEKRAEIKDKKTEQAEKLINEKIAASKDGMIYLYDTDIRAIMEAEKEEKAEKTGAKEQAQAGANLDLRV
ncbi:MAG: hypothetical protein K2H45_05340 [Acetatifactor sp.]|nr:hypothetical protein [Acetatifactor sp.]